jgi:hypothetical protein
MRLVRLQYCAATNEEACQLKIKGRDMSRIAIELEMPDDLARFRLPAGVDARLQELLDRQDKGIDLSPAEREEAEGLVNLAEFLTWLRLRAERQRPPRKKRK